ncbi:hypothetical protein CKAN_00124100 [Cinnamomum micranthum f. kanehirae]|uniref:Uncharacterized protein n=1 Tax=Cinnamomum micranthum f. kanehirae TaxID=337451 RepID=A0A3S3LWS6_9MAGN|nr:hypothetical protein CKAN_00124100 [Cinnamomum micranthum f. kanehirae]
MSDTHVRRRPQSGQAPVQAEEAETDSIEDRLFAIEHAVYDQSVQIEQLEEKMATVVIARYIMPPKTYKGKRPAGSSSRFNTERFKDAECVALGDMRLEQLQNEQYEEVHE